MKQLAIRQDDHALGLGSLLQDLYLTSSREVSQDAVGVQPAWSSYL